MKDELIAALEPLVRRVRTDATAIRGANGPAWTREALTPARLAKHLNGGPARGVCPIKAGESTTMVAVLDLDSHKGESTWDEMVAAAEEISGELLMRGIRVNPWRSGGGNGVHLIVMWDEPQDAHSVRQELADALGECGYRDGAGGVAKGQVEIFPKQDEVAADKFGNQFFLPLTGKSEPLVPALGWEPGGRESAVGMQWQVSVPVTVRERPVRHEAAATDVDLDLLDRALFSIQNDISDRDTWFRLMCAYKEGGGQKETARRWTQQHPSYTDEGFDGPWDSIKVGKPGGTPVGFLLSVAEEHGFKDLVAAEFDVVSLPPGVMPAPEWPRDKQGYVACTAIHVHQALERPDVIGFRLGVDEFMGRRVIAAVGETAWRPFKDSDYWELRKALENLKFKNPSQDIVREGARAVAEQNSFDSAIDWATGLRWDGVPRVEQFFIRYLGVADTAYHRSVGLYLWTALAGRCLQPGCKVDMVPVLISAQGSGKTSMVEALAPTEEAFVEVNLEHRNEDQAARALRGKLVGEIAELRGLGTREAEDIKAWITRRHEEIRALYSEFHAKYPRRLVMIGTGNNAEFLTDDTGERRWLPLNVGATDLMALRADRDQLWAEGVELFRQAGVQWREAQTLALAEHGAFKVIDPWHEAIEGWLARDTNNDEIGAPRGALPVRTGELSAGALAIDVRHLARKDELRIGRVMRALGYEKRTVRRGEWLGKAWAPTSVCKFQQTDECVPS